MRIKIIEMGETKNGAPFKKCTLDEHIKGKDRFNIFKFHSRYEEVTEGAEFVENNFEFEGKFLGLIDPFKEPNNKAPSKKAEEIRVAQDHKEESIAFFNAINSAISLTVAYKDQLKNTSEMKMFIQEWRDWFLKEWSDNKDPTNKPPFK